MLLDYVKRGTLASIHADEVMPFLRNNLRWRVLLTQSDGELIVVNAQDSRLILHVNNSVSTVAPESIISELQQFVVLDEEIVRHIPNNKTPLQV